MKRKLKTNKKINQNSQTNTEHNQGSRIPPPTAFKKDTFKTKQTYKADSLTKGRTGLLEELTTKICKCQIQKHEEQRSPPQPQKHQQKQPCSQAKDQYLCQLKAKQAQDKYRSSKEEPHYECLAHACPSLSMELLSRVPSHLETLYTPQPRHAHHLPPLSSKFNKEPTQANPEGADGDRVLYKNAKFGFESSVERSVISDRSTKRLIRDQKIPQKSQCPEDKDSSPLVKSAREHCRQMNARFKAKYSEKTSESDSFGDTRKTLISGKSAGDLRSVVRSQIHVQELIDQSKRKLKKAADKRLETLSSLSDFSINSRSERQDSKLDMLENIQQKDIKQGKLLLSVSVEEMVSTKLIAPVVRKVQRMYLGTLREEMSIIEDLERLPCQVSSVFQTADDQKKLKNK
ncbi:uncharacterized protein LOC117779937 [Drosophila innubila]|uniref:uncharacterized protein LOC117779937 n=1 Tax=Drosophila innubila TaxID=198719 RepID=UPI00148CF45E|nr:uncharacterized protein LOC117779937 [Drosophila innubila]